MSASLHEQTKRGMLGRWLRVQPMRSTDCLQSLRHNGRKVLRIQRLSLVCFHPFSLIQTASMGRGRTGGDIPIRSPHRRLFHLYLRPFLLFPLSTTHPAFSVLSVIPPLCCYAPVHLSTLQSLFLPFFMPRFLTEVIPAPV